MWVPVTEPSGVASNPYEAVHDATPAGGIDMQPFDVQAIAIAAPLDAVFRYVSDRYALPEWTHAFRQIETGAATLRTPAGTVEIDLTVHAHLESGAIDWIMTFPDRSVGRAHARIVRNVDDSTILTFILLAPPVPQEQLEGTLEQQKIVLREELRRLKWILEGHA